MQAFRKPMDVVHKSPTQPVTETDLAVDKLLRERLLATRPDYGWLSEETADNSERVSRSHVWIVDPIDGTDSFVAGRAEFAISIGLAVEGLAVLGVVANPATGEVFWARRGGGAFLERQGGAPVALRVRAHQPERLPVILASRSEIARGEFEQLFARWSIEPLGSTAYKLAAIAAGIGDAFLSRGTKSEWDVCGGSLILEEAGGRVTDLAGRVYAYNRVHPTVYGVVATTGPDHDELLAAARLLSPTGRLKPDSAREET
jgi:myo-inositol-1(or 4)-monophosphatase